MVETTGAKLAKARLDKGITVDAASHATKLRPDKILALEHDDYSRFPNNAYVKGFLQLYGRYLGVEVSAAVRELENPNPVSVSDYQYLNHAPHESKERGGMRRQHQGQNRPSLAPLIVFILLCLAVGTGGYIWMNAKRLESFGASTETIGESAPPEAKVETPAVVPLEIPAVAAPTLQISPEPVRETVPAASPVEMRAAPVVLSDRDFIQQASPSPVAPPVAGVNEVVLLPVKKTWVKIRRDDPASEPIFEDYLYTNAPPLKLRGARFFIEMREAGALAISKNGAPIAYQGPGVVIQ